MPSIDHPAGQQPAPEPLTRLPFEPITREHIMHCSYDYWHPKYRSSAIKSRIIPLTPPFLAYLRADGIVLPSEDSSPTFLLPETYSQAIPTSSSSDSEWDDSPEPDPSSTFPTLHQTIKTTIAELGGLVAPKLNWSAPKDATWISMKKNSMECATPNDIYLLLKSSDFVTHDLEHAFDDTSSCFTSSEEITQEDIKYVLILRKWFKVNPSCEFRCFVRDRRVIGICQRDLNHFSFLFSLKSKILTTILAFFEKTLKITFPDKNFVFDIYLPEPYDRVRLMDINPWAPRTDPLLFSWLELLTLKMPEPLLGIPDSNPLPEDDDTQDEEDVEEWKPELRLVGKNDPEAYAFASPQYSAHKLPREVVEAGMTGEGGMREFAREWKMLVENGVGVQGEQGEEESSDDGEGEGGV